MNKTEKKKIIFSFVVFCFLFTLIILKAINLQIINHNKLMSYFKKQILRETIIYPNRGHIYDREGRPLAINVQKFSLFAIPENNQIPRKDLRTLSNFIPDLSYQKMLSTLKKRNRYTWLARNISIPKKYVEKIKDMEHIYIEQASGRFYPNNDLLSQVLGFVGVDNSGLSGIEFLYDKTLKGNAKIFRYLLDAKGRPVKFEGMNTEHSAQELHLSINKDVQAMAELYLKEAVIKNKALKGGVGIMNPQTGEIIAMANYPSFDPNKVEKSTPEQRKLSFISDPFEPGSIFKIFTIAAGLENDIIDSKTSYFCENGKFPVDNHIIHEAETGKGHEWLTIEEILAFSSNIGTTKLAFDLTFPHLKTMLTKLNIGEKTGIEVPGESRGIFTNRKNVSLLTLSNISFGQGVAATGIQILAAYAAVANGGIYVKPTIIKTSQEEALKNSHRVMRPSVAKSLEKMLIRAVENGTGDNAKIPFFTIAGKTSTAQKPSVEGGYNKDYIPGFIGHPVNVKEPFVIFVYIDSPQLGKYYGNTIAAPVFKKMAQYLLYKNKNHGQITLKKGENNHGKIQDIKNRTLLKRSFGKNIMPNFIGLDKLSAEKLANKTMPHVLTHFGQGIVTKQFPNAGIDISHISPDNILSPHLKLYYELPRYE